MSKSYIAYSNIDKDQEDDCVICILSDVNDCELRMLDLMSDNSSGDRVVNDIDASCVNPEYWEYKMDDEIPVDLYINTDVNDVVRDKVWLFDRDSKMEFGYSNNILLRLPMWW